MIFIFSFRSGNHHIEKISAETIEHILSSLDNEQISSLLEGLGPVDSTVGGDRSGSKEEQIQFLQNWAKGWKQHHNIVSDTTAVDDIQRAHRDFSDELVDRGFFDFAHFLMTLAQQVPK